MVHVREDGIIWGELLTLASGRRLPKDFTVANPARFFDIPAELRQHNVQTQPHHEEIILSLEEPSGCQVCSFLASQLPEDSPLRAALDQLELQIKGLVGQ